MRHLCRIGACVLTHPVEGFTFSHSGEDKAGAPLSAAVQRCSTILTDAGVPGITEQMGRDAGAVAICDSFFLWVTAMRIAPPNPRRADCPAALAAVGEGWESAYAGRATFRPGKCNGGDDYAPVTWGGDCSCYTQTGPRAAANHLTARSNACPNPSSTSPCSIPR